MAADGPRRYRVYKAMNRPLTVLGAERRLFFVALITGGAVFSLMHSLAELPKQPGSSLRDLHALFSGNKERTLIYERIERDRQRLEQKVRSLCGQLNNLMTVTPLGAEETLRILRRLVNFWPAKNQHARQLDLRLCDSELEAHRGYLRLDDDYVRGLTLKELPYEHGPFRLGYSAYIHSRLIPVLEMLNMPGISSPARSDEISSDFQTGVVLECASTPQLVSRVLHGQLHAAVGVLPVADQDIWTKPITREPFCLCISKNHRLAKQPSAMARELDGEVIFFLPPAVHPGLYDRTIEYIESVGARPILREVISLPHAMEIVTRNLGAALLPRSASRLSCMGVTFKPVTDKLLGIETALFLRRDQQKERVQSFLNTLLTRIRGGAPET